MAEQKSSRVGLSFEGTGWQALGWGLLAILLSLLVIPAAWGIVYFCRWFARNLSFSDGTEASFEGRGGEVWYYFVIYMIIVYVTTLVSRSIGPVGPRAFVSIILPIAMLPIYVAIWLRITRWFFASIELSCGTKLNFKGKYLPFFGWSLLIYISLFTIIGWAWAYVAMFRWICHNIEGGGNRVTFNGGGVGLLWRGWLTVLASVAVIPYPWMFAWLVRWFAEHMEIERAEM